LFLFDIGWQCFVILSLMSISLYQKYLVSGIDISEYHYRIFIVMFTTMLIMEVVFYYFLINILIKLEYIDCLRLYSENQDILQQ